MNRKPQTEEIKWLPYPEYKPKREGEYLVQTIYPFDTMKKDYFSDGGWYMFKDDAYVAWAEMPKGYKEE